MVCRRVKLVLLLGMIIPTYAIANVSLKGKISIKYEGLGEFNDYQNVVVFINNAPSLEKIRRKTDKAITMASEHMQFVPDQLVIQKGEEIIFPNKDVIFHNVFSLSQLRPFDLGLYNKDTSPAVKFTESGWLKVYCNIHESMIGNILVLDNPFFTTANNIGEYEIKEIPPGDYEVIWWYKSGNFLSEKLDLKKDLVKNPFFQVSKHSTRHKNKWGKDYKSKY